MEILPAFAAFKGVNKPGRLSMRIDNDSAVQMQLPIAGVIRLAMNRNRRLKEIEVERAGHREIWLSQNYDMNQALN